MADGYIDIDVRLNDDQARSQANSIGRQLGKEVSSSVDSAAKAANTSTTNAIRGIGTALTGFGATMSKAVTVPILAASVASGAAAVKIDTALTGVRKTVDGTEQQYEALKDAAIDFSKTNAVDPAQILDIQALGAQLGYTIDELDMFGEVVSGLDIATNMNAEEAATELAQFANIMGMSHDETENYGAAIVDLGNHFATTEADISHMAMRIAGAGKQIGMSEADVLGLSTALSSMGINAEAGGTAISTIMSNIDKAVATSSDTLEIWASAAGMSAQEFADAWKDDPVQALSAVLSGMDAATQEGGNMSVMLEELGINAIRQTDTLKRLANNVDMLPKAVDTANKAWEENTALTKEVDNRNASLAAQLQIFFNKLQAVAEEVGGPLMESLVGIIDAAQPLIDLLASGAKAFSDLDTAEQQTILTAIAVMAAIGPLSSGIGKLLSGVGKTSEAWAEFKKNLDVAKQGITAAQTSTAAATQAFGKFFAVEKNGQTIIMKTNSATGTYAETNSKLARTLATTTTGIKLQTAAQKLSNTAMAAGKVAVDGLKMAMSTFLPILVLTAAVEIIAKVSSALSEAKEHADIYKQATEGMTQAHEAYNEALASSASSMAEAGDSAEQYAQSVGEVTEACEESLKAQSELTTALSDIWKQAGTNAGMVEQYTDTIEELTSKTELNAQEQAQLKVAVDGLNSIMGTNYEVMDAVHGELSATTAEIKKNSDAWIKNAKAQAAQESLEKIYERQQENRRNLEAADKSLKEAERGLGLYIGDFAVIADGNAVAYHDLENSRRELEEADARLADEEQSQIAIMQEVMGATDEAAESNKEASQAATENAEATEGLTEATSNCCEVTDDMVDSVNEAIDKYPILAYAMMDLGYTSEDIAAKLAHSGSKAEDLGKAVEETADKTSDAFNKMERATNVSLDTMRETLENNKNLTAEWSENTRLLYEKAGSAVEKDFVKYVSSLGPEYAGLLGELVNDTTGQLTELANSWDEGMKLGRQAGLDQVVGMSDDIMATVREIDLSESGHNVILTFANGVTQEQQTAILAALQVVDLTDDELAKLQELAATDGADAVIQYAQSIKNGQMASENAATANANSANTGFNKADGLGAGIKQVADYAKAIAEGKSGSNTSATENANAAAEGFQSRNGDAEGWGNHLTNNFASGISGAIDTVIAAGNAVASTIANILGHTVPKEGILREGGKGEAVWGQHLVENIAEGMTSQRSRRAIREASREVAVDINDTLLAEMARIDPMAQLEESLAKGSAAFSISAMMAGTAPSYSTNTQMLNFNQPITSPDELARTMRLQQHYGLAGAQ